MTVESTTPIITTDIKKAPETLKPKPPTSPWKPASQLTVNRNYLKSGFTQRWCRKDDYEKKLEEGWTPVISKHPSSVNPGKTLIDGTPLDNTVQKRELILMEMSNEMVESRRKYHEEITNGLLRSKKDEFDKETAVEGHGKRAYGKITIE